MRVGIAETGTLTAHWGAAPDQKCSFRYQLPPKQKDDGPFARIDARCVVDPPSLNTENDNGKADLNNVTGQR